MGDSHIRRSFLHATTGKHLEGGVAGRPLRSTGLLQVIVPVVRFLIKSFVSCTETLNVYNIFLC